MIKRTFTSLLTLLITPFASWWLYHHEKKILRLGIALTPVQLNWAKQLHISQPEKIRVLVVERMPSPVPYSLEKFMQRHGFPVGNAAGMCMRYGIYLVDKYAHRDCLLAHELVHTHQFQRLGSIHKFLYHYLYQTLLLGYANAPMEAEANTKAKQVTT